MNDKGFYVQMHIHTAETSACGQASGAEIARACKDAGYDMIVITDHFMNANIGCPRDWPWADQVEYLFRGYEAAKAEGDKIGLEVLFGWETFNNGPEFLTYGLGREFLLNNPDLAQLDAPAYLDRVRKAGGFVIHAHPFRRRDYIPLFTPDANSVEAFEVWNAAHTDHACDEQAREMAEEYGLICTAGSDAHRTESVTGGAMRFFHPVHTTDELVAALRAREFEIVRQL